MRGLRGLYINELLPLVKEGLSAAANCRRVFDGLEERMFTGLTDGEREATYSLVSRLIANLESEDTDNMNNMELSKLLQEGK